MLQSLAFPPLSSPCAVSGVISIAQLPVGMTAEVQLVSFISIFSTSFSRTLHVNSPPERKPFLAETQSYKMLFVKREITTVVVIFFPFSFPVVHSEIRVSDEKRSEDATERGRKVKKTRSHSKPCKTLHFKQIACTLN